MVNKFYHLDFVYNLIVLTKFNQPSRKTYANKYRLKETVCSDSLVENLFTKTAIDNTDHNETSTTSSSHFN